MCVLVLAEKIDATVDRVVMALTGHGVPVLRVDTADFPDRVVLEAELRREQWCGVLRTRQRLVLAVGGGRPPGLGTLRAHRHPKRTDVVARLTRCPHTRQRINELQTVCNGPATALGAHRDVAIVHT